MKPTYKELEARTRELESEARLATSCARNHAMEIDALRAEVARLRDDLAHEQRCAAARSQPVEPHLSTTLTADNAALRARLAETEAERDHLSAELVGLREAAHEALKAAIDSALAVGRHPNAAITLDGHERWARDIAAKFPAITSAAALGARVIEEAERRGKEEGRDEMADRIGLKVEAAIASAGWEVPDGSGCDSGDPADYIAAQVWLLLARAENQADEDAAAIEAAREEGRAEERMKLGGIACVACKAERDEARRERDEARAAMGKCHVCDGDCGWTGPGEQPEWTDCDACAGTGRNDPVVKLRAERDAALAKLAEVSESAKAYMEARLGGDTPDMSPFIDRLDDALSRAPSTALAERDARVRKTALEEAAEAWERRVAERAPDFAAGLSHGNVVAGMEEATRFLRSLASRGGGA